MSKKEDNMIISYIRRSLLNLAKQFLCIIKKIEYKYQYKALLQLIGDEDFDVVNNSNEIPSGKKIIFIIPGMLTYIGGHISILRLGTILHRYGYEVTYVTYGSQTKEEMEMAARLNLKNYAGNFLDKNFLNKVIADFVVATSWWSVYLAKKIKGYKLYFVQDYEPYFFCYGDNYFLAKTTYSLGFHIISLGKWNRAQISTNANIPIETIDYIDFPYEPNEYKIITKDYSQYTEKTNLKIVVYIKSDTKRLPILLQIITKKLIDEMKKRGKVIKIIYFGSDNVLKLHNGINVGKLCVDELNKLYREADFGIVASMTNISLVPYEMLASGLPVIEFKDGSFNYFFPDECAIISDFNAKHLADKIEEYCNNPTKLNLMISAAQAILKGLSWNKSGEQFIKILDGIQKTHF